TFNVVLANETMARIAGLGSVAEGIGLNPLQFVHPHDQERAARIIVQDLFEKDLHETHEYRAITCDGREIWIEAVGRRIQYQGKRAGLISVRDITDRKRAERLINIQHDLAQALSAARDLHEGLHLCLEAARMASGMDCGGIYLREETSGAMELAFHQGLSQDFVKRASRFEAGSANCRLVMEGRPVYTQHPDLVASLDADSQGEGLKAIAVIPMTYEDLVIGCLNVASRVMDEVPVAVRKALELIAAQVSPAIISLGAREALRKSELRFRTIFENANDEIVLLDQWGTVIDRNKKGADLLGYTFEEVIGKKFTDLGSMLEPRSDHTVRKLFAAANEQPTREPWIIEVRAFHKDGSPVFLEASTSILEKGGKMDGLLVTLRDITERKQAEEQILQRNRHLATLNEIAQTINQSIDLDEILGNTLDKTLEILNTGYGSVHLMDQDQQTLTLRIHRGMIPDRLANYRTIQIGKGFLAQIPHLEEPTFIESLANLSTLTPPDAALIDEFQLKSAMLIPLKAKGELLGIMCMLTADQRIFTLEERELLTTVGHQISTAIENAQLIEEVSQ
ncbi:MAG: PAS domain S-box protein, partial [Chloroflexi bacterium]|nr:PAS domain S-box protein [Chloroflexota bacterium]